MPTFPRAGALHARDEGMGATVTFADCSPTCDLGEHRDCLHMYGSGEVGEGEVALCSCDCHQSCAMAGQRAVGFWEWRSACTCPAVKNMRRVQDRAGSDPAVMARKLESFRQELASGEDARKQIGKRALVKGYEVAAAQAAGQPVDPDTAMENPQLTMRLIVDALARIESGETAGRLLGLSDAEVAAMRESAMEFRVGTAFRFLDSARKNRKWRVGWFGRG